MREKQQNSLHYSLHIFKIYHIFVFRSNSFSVGVLYKTSIFKTVRSLDTTWNCAGSITRVSTHEFTKKKVLEQLTLAVACSTRRRPACGEASISEWDVTWRTVKVELRLPATTIHTRSHVTFPYLVLELFLIWGSFFNFKADIVLKVKIQDKKAME